LIKKNTMLFLDEARFIFIKKTGKITHVGVTKIFMKLLKFPLHDPRVLLVRVKL
jgi:hypothetical protein